MAKGDVQRLKRRKPIDAEIVRKRVAKFCECDHVDVPAGVQPLNTGFFMLERMRQQNVAQHKARAAKRGKLKGK